MNGEADLIRVLGGDLDRNAGRVRHPIRCVGTVREGAFDEGEGSARGLEQATAAADQFSLSPAAKARNRPSGVGQIASVT